MAQTQERRAGCFARRSQAELTEAELAQVTGGEDGPTSAGDHNGKATPILM
jgi:bacteriocin-like protein